MGNRRVPVCKACVSVRVRMRVRVPWITNAEQTNNR